MTVYATTDMVGTSGTSVSDAIRGAIERASATFEDLQWFEVKEIRGRVADNSVEEFQVRIQIGFKLHAPDQADIGSEGQARGTTGTRQTRSTAAQVARKGGSKKRSDLAKGFEKQSPRGKSK